MTEKELVSYRHLQAKVAKANAEYRTRLVLDFKERLGDPCLFCVYRNGILLFQSNHEEDIVNRITAFLIGWEHCRSSMGYRTRLETGE